MTLLDALNQRVLLGDGANGTLIASFGFTKQPIDLANLEAPELVLRAHQQYVTSGADFVETNTFMSNRIRLEGRGVSIAEINRQGAEIAREAAAGKAFVMGAIGPIGKPLAPFGSVDQADAREAFAEQISGLILGGVDGFFLETFVDLAELELAVAEVRKQSDLPIFASKAFIEDGDMLGDGLPIRVAKTLSGLGVTAAGANCVVGPQRMLDIVRMMAEATTAPLIAFPTPGLPQLVKGQVTYDISPEYFARAAARLVEEGARVIGGCCGTTPAHIAEMRRAIDAGIKPKARTVITRTAAQKEELPRAEPSRLSGLLASKFVTAVELDVPRGLRIEKLIDAARQMKDAQCDVINISDGARARLRMDPTAVCKLIQDQVEIEVTMHVSCRDRNLLAIQSDLLGAHALGLRNILAITGDPATIGDYPSATSVFDIDSIGLCRIMGRFNEGLDLAGNSVGMRSAFTICCAYNPGALDQELEDDRLRRKVDAGAAVVYTQPVFDLEGADRSVELCRSLNVKCLIGVLPLKSARHAEFMHNEVPGVSVPEALRHQLAQAAGDEAALEVGIQAARSLIQHIRSIAEGLYLMPPFGSAAIARQVIEA